MIVVLSPRAVQRLREIQAWIAYDNLTAAVQVIQRIRQTTEILADHPKLGPLWRGGPSRGVVVSGWRSELFTGLTHGRSGSKL